MKIASVVGARPEFIQCAPISRALREMGKHREILIHTGQHYDYLMSQAFFDELGIPEPDYNLEVGSASHGKQTAEMLSRMEDVFLGERPDIVVVRGDTNSTVAGALAACKLQIPSVHVEAGERSYDRREPEEINRLIADHIADLHLCATQSSASRLAAEGITSSVHWVGDVMFDALLHNRSIAARKSKILKQLSVAPQEYVLVTVHRASNTDDPKRLEQIVSALNAASEPIVFPVHPRTRKVLDGLGSSFAKHIRLLEPVGYFDMLMLEEHARLIATDSGGVQREAYMFGVPCLTLRDNTEWTDTVTSGWNKLVGADAERIRKAWSSFTPPAEQPPIFGNGQAGRRIAEILASGAASFGNPHR